MDHGNPFSLTNLFIMVAVEAVVFGTLGVSALQMGGHNHAHAVLG